MCVCVCVCVCVIISLYGWVYSCVWLFLCTLIRYLVLWVFFCLCLVGCFSMIIQTPAVLSVLYACVLYFCICAYSAQLSMFHMERHSRNMLIIIITIIIIIITRSCWSLLGVNMPQDVI